MGIIKRPRRLRHLATRRCVPRSSRFCAVLALMAPIPDPPAEGAASPAPEPPAPEPPAETTSSIPELHQNYQMNCQSSLNNQINLELYAAYTYRSVAAYFNSGNLTFREIAEFFQQQSIEQTEHAKRLMCLHEQRGGLTNLHDLNNPIRNNWYSTLRAVECALCLAKSVHENLLDLQQMAVENNDVHLSNFLEQNSLHEQLKSIQEVGNQIAFLFSLGQPEIALAEKIHDELNLDDKKD